MFYYLIYNSTFIKKDALNNKNVTTLIYGTIVYILVHALIYVNKSIKDTLLRYFWVLFSVDIISIFLSTEITSEIQNHNFIEDINIKKKKKKNHEEIKDNVYKDRKDARERKDSREKKESRVRKEPKIKSNEEVREKLKKVESTQSGSAGIKSNSIEDLQRSRMEMDFKNKTIDITETQNILDEIEQENLISEDKKNNIDLQDDNRSEISDGSDLDIDLESFEKSLLED